MLEKLWSFLAEIGIDPIISKIAFGLIVVLIFVVIMNCTEMLLDSKIRAQGRNYQYYHYAPPTGPPKTGSKRLRRKMTRPRKYRSVA